MSPPANIRVLSQCKIRFPEKLDHPKSLKGHLSNLLDDEKGLLPIKDLIPYMSPGQRILLQKQTDQACMGETQYDIVLLQCLVLTKRHSVVELKKIIDGKIAFYCANLDVQPSQDAVRWSRWNCEITAWE